MICSRSLCAPIQNIDDMTVLTFAQLPDKLLSQKDGCQQIDGQVDVAVVQIDPRECAVLKYRRAVDQRRHFTKFSGGFESSRTHGRLERVDKRLVREPAHGQLATMDSFAIGCDPVGSERVRCDGCHELKNVSARRSAQAAVVVGW